MDVNPDPSAARGGPRVSVGGAVPRAVVVIGAVLVVIAGGQLIPVALAPLAVGVLLAAVRPATIGAWVALPAAVVTFVSATGTDPGLGPVLLGTGGVYLLHTGTAAAAVFGWSAQVPVAVARRWLLRCLPAVLVTALLVTVDATVGRTPRSTVFAVAAMAAALVAGALLFRLLTAARDDDPAAH